MLRRIAAVLVVSSIAFAGCSAMEQYHFPQTQDKVPVPVILAFSEKYPNDVIKGITEQKMFDGAVRYQFTIVSSATPPVQRVVAFSADGKPVENPM